MIVAFGVLARAPEQPEWVGVGQSDGELSGRFDGLVGSPAAVVAGW